MNHLYSNKIKNNKIKILPNHNVTSLKIIGAKKSLHLILILSISFNLNTCSDILYNGFKTIQISINIKYHIILKLNTKSVEFIKSKKETIHNILTLFSIFLFQDTKIITNIDINHIIPSKIHIFTSVFNK